MAMNEPSDAPQRWCSPIKERLRRGEAVFGVTITTTSLDLAARAASVGFDFLWIEMEHSPITLETLRNIVLATRGLPAAPFARVPVNELWTAKRVLDQGAHGVIFPFTSNVDRARQAVAACRYPPAGRRGSGNGLALTTWPDADAAGYYDSADENVVTVAVVEEAAALEHVDEIAATPGLDVVFIGTSDLSFSLGSPRQPGTRGRARCDRARAQGGRASRQGMRPAGALARGR